MKNKLKNGDILINKQGCLFEIINIHNSKKCDVVFLDNFKYEVTCQVGNIIRGNVSNPYFKSVYKVGYIGVGDFCVSRNGVHTKEYKAWSHMLERSYSDKYHEKYITYKNVTVCEEWHNFQNFAKWYEENYPKHITDIRFELDKDLLQLNVKNKVYSPKTCIFLPQKVNGFLTNRNKSNTSGVIGARKYNDYKYVASINIFGENKIKTIGYFKDLNLAEIAYKKEREIQSENVKKYLTSFGYLKDTIIDKIK